MVNEMFDVNQEGYVDDVLVFIGQNLVNEKNEVCGKKNYLKAVNVKEDDEVILEDVYVHGI